METHSAKMNVYYECVKCGYETNIKTRIERHFMKTNSCVWKDVESKNKFRNEKEILNESLKKKYRNSDKIFEIFSKNQEESKTDESKESDEETKEYKCNFCDRKSKNKFNMKQHESICKVRKIVENKQNEKKHSEEILTETIQDIEYTPLLCRFFDAMDISHISEGRHVQNVLCSSYQKIFMEILQNERNINFYMSPDLPLMMIYKNEINDVIRIPFEKGYSQICMNIYRYLQNRMEMMKQSSDYNQEILKVIEKQIIKTNKLYRFDSEYKNAFLLFIYDFCKEKKSIIYARFTQNFIMNRDHRSKK